jgi:hypothetical protein
MSEHSNDEVANKSDLVDDLDASQEDAENIKGGASRYRGRPEGNREGRPEGRPR